MMNLEFLVVLFLGLAILFGVLEIFIPSFGILTILAIMSLIACVSTAMKINPLFGLVLLLFLMVTVPILVVLFLKIAPKTRVGQLVFLETKPEDRTAADPIREKLRTLIGKRGKAASLMLPSGRVSVEGKTYDAVGESGAIDPGTEVLVLRSEAAWLVVRALTPEELAMPQDADMEIETATASESTDESGSDSQPASVQIEDPYAATEER